MKRDVSNKKKTKNHKRAYLHSNLNPPLYNSDLNIILLKSAMIALKNNELGDFQVFDFEKLPIKSSSFNNLERSYLFLAEPDSEEYFLLNLFQSS